MDFLDLSQLGPRSSPLPPFGDDYRLIRKGLLNHQSMILRIVTPFAVTVARGHKLLGAIVAPPLRNVLNSRDIGSDSQRE